jgi:hypothetical protein
MVKDWVLATGQVTESETVHHLELLKGLTTQTESEMVHHLELLKGLRIQYSLDEMRMMGL